MKEYRDFNLTEFNSYRVESTCKRALFPESISDFVSYFSKKPKSCILIGEGNNIILSKSYYNEDFIIIHNCFDKVIDRSELTLTVESGRNLESLSKLAAECSLSGLEAFWDIPGTVGGAIVMNAGTGDNNIGNLVSEVTFLDLKDLRLYNIGPESAQFSYRSSIFQNRNSYIILNANLKLRNGSPDEILKKMEDIKSLRWQKQPREYPNAGSVFKRPLGKYVGTMIEELGLKGLQIGGAKISEKHAGFIVNTGNATGNDILMLINEIKTRVYEEFSINLELEQKVI